MKLTPKLYCDQHGACKSGSEFASQFETMEEAWENCPKTDWMFWTLQRSGSIDHPQAVSLAIAFAEIALGQTSSDSNAPANAIQAAKAWLSDPTAVSALACAHAADAIQAAKAWLSDPTAVNALACAHAADRSYAAAREVRALFSSDGKAYTADAAGDAAYAVTRLGRAASCAAGAADAALATFRHSARVAKEKEFCDLIRKVVSNPFAQ